MKKKFWKHYRIFCLIVLSIIIIISIIFYLFLDSYEQGRSTYLAESIVNNINKGNNSEVIKYIKKENYTSENYYKTILQRYNNVSYEKKMGVYKDNSPVYSIINGDKEIATVLLKASDKKGLFNINRWLIDKIELSLNKDDITVIAPHNIDVYINGYKVDKKYINNELYYLSNISNIKNQINVESLNEWIITDVYEDSVVTLSDGNIVNKKGYFVYDFGSNDTLLNELHDYLQNICYDYSRYVSNEHGFDKVTPYLLTKTPTYSFLYGVKNTNIWSKNHTPTVFSNFKLSNMQVYNSDVFSVEATYDYEYVVNSTQEKRNYKAELTLLMVKKNGKWLLGDLTT